MTKNSHAHDDTRAGVYARISLDVGGQALGVARQEADCRAKAQAMGWAVVDVYVDNDVSASKSVDRPQYAHMLADLEAGRINAVVVYDLDRLTRKPSELEAFIDLSDRLGVDLANVAGDVDLSTASGRMVARIKGAVARQEADRIGERVKRQKAQRLESGLPPGSRWRTFGYSREWQVIDEEAAIVSEVFERVARGESVNSVTSDLIERGVCRVSGEAWRYQATARMLGSRIYAGRLSYKGEDAGPSQVPALVSEALFDACQGRERKAAWNTRTGLLSGIAVCGACSTPMNKDGKSYVCARMQGGCGKVRIKVEWLDEAADSVMWFLMTWRPGANDALSVEAPSFDEVDAVEVLDRKIAEIQEAHAAGALDLADAIPMLKALRAERSKALAAREAAVTADATWRHVEDYAAADLSLKRTVIRRHVRAIVVTPTDVRGRSTYDPDRFRFVTAHDGDDGKPREFSGHDCDWLRKMRAAAMAIDARGLDGIQIGWGETDPGTVVVGQVATAGLPEFTLGRSGVLVDDGSQVDGQGVCAEAAA